MGDLVGEMVCIRLFDLLESLEQRVSWDPDYPRKFTFTCPEQLLQAMMANPNLESPVPPTLEFEGCGDAATGGLKCSLLGFLPTVWRVTVMALSSSGSATEDIEPDGYLI